MAADDEALRQPRSAVTKDGPYLVCGARPLIRTAISDFGLLLLRLTGETRCSVGKDAQALRSNGLATALAEAVGARLQTAQGDFNLVEVLLALSQ